MTPESPRPLPDLSRRNAPRIKTQLHVQIIGVDANLRLRAADISMSGLYVQTDRAVGELGSVQRLRLASADLAVQLGLLARVVRVAQANDFWRGNQVSGVAFEFICEESADVDPPQTIALEESSRLREFMHHLAHQATSTGAQLNHIWRATLDSSIGSERTATVTGVSLQGTVLETDFPVPAGEMIRVEIPGPNREQRIALLGRAVDTQPLDERAMRFRTTVSFAQPAERPQPIHSSIQDALDGLVTRTPAATVRPHARRQLAGDLSRVSLSTLLTVCELERASGILQLRRADELVACYVRDGRLLDVESPQTQDPRTALATVLDWKAGSFEFLFQPVSRPDRVGMSATALLFSLVQQRAAQPVQASAEARSSAPDEPDGQETK